ncbi:MAG: outer membrane lipoprotein carrier protein LolA [Bacteroidales bacterium]|nr:outer membrane lipoprotein carrier protein LolA [Bacteroidales bacterium]MCF8405989.1 outer membrane lipoprotein carrier protein LolA [Bacteroidales bacterium]
MRYLLILFLILSLFSFTTAQDVEKGDKKSMELLDKLTAKTESYKTIEVDFTYKMLNEEADIDETTQGVLKIMGNKYRLNIAGQDVISDGETVWTYIPDADEVQINSVEDSEESITPNKLLLSYNDDYKSKFIKETFQYGATVNVVDLTPYEGKTYYKVRLVIDAAKDQLYEITIFDKNGSTYSYIINKFIANPDIPESEFTFNEKDFPGVEKVDMR